MTFGGISSLKSFLIPQLVGTVSFLFILCILMSFIPQINNQNEDNLALDQRNAKFSPEFSFNKQIKNYQRLDNTCIQSLQQTSNPTIKLKNNEIEKGSRLQKVNPPFGESFQSFTHSKVQIWSLDFSPDGSLLASGSDDNTIKIWDMKDLGREVTTLVGHTGRIRSLDFSPDGSLLASGSNDRTLIIWDVVMGETRCKMTSHTHTVRCLAFSPDGSLLASGSFDSTIKIWNSTTWKEIYTIPAHSGWVTSISFSPDGKLLASGSVDSTIKLWNTSTWEQLSFSPLKGHKSEVLSVDISPNGSMLASGSADTHGEDVNTIKLWDLTTGESFLTLSGHNSWAYCVSFSPKDEILASGSPDKTVKLWNLTDGKIIKTITDNLDGIWGDSVVFSPDGTILASGDENGVIRLWNVAIGSELKRMTLRRHTEKINSLAFSPNGTLLASGSVDKKVKLWNIFTGSEEKDIPYSDEISSVAISPDGFLLMIGQENSLDVILWNLSSGKQEIILETDPYSEGVSSVTFSQDGKLCAAGCYPFVTIWNLSMIDKPFQFAYPGTGEYSSVTFSPDGEFFAACQDEKILIWSYDNSSWNFYDAISTNSSLINSVIFSPNGSLLASGSSDGVVTFWDVLSGAEIKTFPRNDRAVNSVIFSPDGNIFAYCDNEKFKLWNMTSEEEIQTFPSESSYMTTIAFSPDGRTIASAGTDGSIVLWGISPIPLDFDFDGITDSWEREYKLDPTNFWDKFDDIDSDGLMNSIEFFINTNPQNNDSDGDKMPDGWEFLMRLNFTIDDSTLDADDDGMPNLWEYTYGLNPRDRSDAFIDSDGDWIDNIEEFNAGTDPTNFWDFPLFSYSAVHDFLLKSIIAIAIGSFILLYVIKINREALKRKLEAPDYKTAKKIQRIGFSSHTDLIKAGAHARSLVDQGKTSYFQGDYKSAVQQFELARLVSERLEDRRLIAEVLFLSVWIQKRRKSFKGLDLIAKQFPSPPFKDPVVKIYSIMLEAIKAEADNNWNLARIAWKDALDTKGVDNNILNTCKGALIEIAVKMWLNNPTETIPEELLVQLDDWQEFCQNNQDYDNLCSLYLLRARIAVTLFKLDEVEEWLTLCTQTADESNLKLYKDFVVKETEQFYRHKQRVASILQTEKVLTPEMQIDIIADYVKRVRQIDWFRDR
ncbi:MAG: hypothetical protein ACFFAE_17875 [Candidatus Hodarchaeota archaeon]